MEMPRKAKARRTPTPQTFHEPDQKCSKLLQGWPYKLSGPRKTVGKNEKEDVVATPDPYVSLQMSNEVRAALFVEPLYYGSPGTSWNFIPLWTGTSPTMKSQLQRLRKLCLKILCTACIRFETTRARHKALIFVNKILRMATFCSEGPTQGTYALWFEMNCNLSRRTGCW